MLRVTDKGWPMNLGRWTIRFLVIAGVSLACQIFWFLTMNQTDFPTGEVQYAVMPALLHPYKFPWQAPYSIFWYGAQYAIALLPISFFLNYSFLFNWQCPNNCNAIVQYLNGTQINVPYDGGIFQYILATAWMIGLTVWNLPVLYRFRQSELAASYFATSLWFWATTPVNLSVFWIVAMSFEYPELLPLAIIFKLPFGAPNSVWGFALGSGSTIGHWFPYGLLGIWWIASLVHRLDQVKHQGRSLWVPWLGLKWRRLKDYEPEDRYLVRWKDGRARFTET